MEGLLKVTSDTQKARALRALAGEHYDLARGGAVRNHSIRLTLFYTALEQYCLALLSEDGYKVDTSKPGGHRLRSLEAHSRRAGTGSPG
jgi:hypothetical protein